MCVQCSISRTERSKIKILENLLISENNCVLPSMLTNNNCKGMSSVVWCSVSHECLGRWPWLVDDTGNSALEYSRADVQECAACYLKDIIAYGNCN